MGLGSAPLEPLQLKTDLKYSKNERLNNSSIGAPWTQTLFHHMGYARQFVVAGKAEAAEV